MTPDPDLPFRNEDEMLAVATALEGFLSPIAVLEWGCGHSTVYFPGKVPALREWLAIEHDLAWQRTVQERIQAPVHIHHVPKAASWNGLTEGSAAEFKDYILKPATLDTTFEVIIVDGQARVECLQIGWLLLAPRGLMILHDAQRAEYVAGRPRNGHFLTITHTNGVVDDPIQTTFFSHSAQHLAMLKGKLAGRLSDEVRFQVDEGTARVLASDPRYGFGPEGPPLRLYAGDLPEHVEYLDWLGLSLYRQDHRHLLCDLTLPLPFPDGSIEAFQAEDVLEHIRYEALPGVLDEIHRVLMPGALFRLSVPDYGCDVLRQRCVKDAFGNLVFDPGGGGTPDDPGHVWFPRLDVVKALLRRTRFATHGVINFLHYWNMDGTTWVTRPIDYARGMVQRTPDFDARVKNPYRPMSLVADLSKQPIRASDGLSQGMASQAVADGGPLPGPEDTSFHPRVSAIVSVYKARRFIDGCLEDLEAQSLFRKGELEIVVVDSGSPEGEAALITAFADRHPGRVQYLRTPERETIYAAWNRGVLAARGNYLTNANADDRHRPDALELLAAALDAHPEVALAYANDDVTQEANGTFLDAPRTARLAWPEFDPVHLFEICYAGPHPLWRKRLHQEHGLFDPGFRSAGDYDFWLRLVAAGERFLHVPEVLGLYLQSQEGVEWGDTMLSGAESLLARVRNWPKAWGNLPEVRGTYLVPIG